MERIVLNNRNGRTKMKRAKLCEHNAKMYNRCKITRSVHVKGSSVIRFSLTIYTLLRHRRIFVKVGERTFSASEKNSLSEATRDNSNAKCIWTTKCNTTSLLDVLIDKRKNLLQISLFPRSAKNGDRLRRENSRANTSYKEMSRFAGNQLA